MNSKFCRVLFVFGVISTTLLCRADLTVKMQVTESKLQKIQGAVLKFAKDKARLDVDGGAGHPAFTSLLNFSEKKATIITPQMKTYVVISEEMVSMLKPPPSKEESGEDLKSNKGTKPVKPQFAKSGMKQNINGLECEEMVCTLADGASISFWISQHAPSFKAYIHPEKEIGYTSLNLKAFGQWLPLMGSVPELMTFPQKVVLKDKNGLEQFNLLVELLDEVAVPAGQFMPPPDFKEIPMSLGSSAFRPSGGPTPPTVQKWKDGKSYFEPMPQIPKPSKTSKDADGKPGEEGSPAGEKAP